MGRWTRVVIVAALVVTAMLTAAYHYSSEERKQPRFYDRELRPRLVCLFDRVQDEVVPDTCREAQL